MNIYLIFILFGIMIFLLLNKYNTFSIGGNGLLTEYIDDITNARKYMFMFLSDRFNYWDEDTDSDNIIIIRGGDQDTLLNENQYNIGNIRTNGLTNQTELLIGTLDRGRIYEVTLEVNDIIYYQEDGERLEFFRCVEGIDGNIDLEYIGPNEGNVRNIYLEMIEYINSNRGEPGGLHIMRRRFCASRRV